MDDAYREKLIWKATYRLMGEDAEQLLPANIEAMGDHGFREADLQATDGVRPTCAEATLRYFHRGGTDVYRPSDNLGWVTLVVLQTPKLAARAGAASWVWRLPKLPWGSR